LAHLALIREAQGRQDIFPIKEVWNAEQSRILAIAHGPTA